MYPVACHTDNIGPGSTFVAIKGFAENGVAFIAHAIKKGATHVVIDAGASLSQELLDLAAKKRVVIERVANTRKALAVLGIHAAG